MRRRLLTVAGMVGLACWPGLLRGQEVPPLEVLLEGAETREDSLAIREAYRALGDARAQGAIEELERRAGEALGERPVTAGADTTAAPPPRAAASAEGIPDPDDIYRILSASRDTTDPGRAPIEYRGERLVLYPESETILLQGSDGRKAAAGQAGTELQANRILYRNDDGTIEAFGGATVASGQSQVQADSLFYDRRSRAVATFGLTDLREEGSTTQGSDVVYDLERKSGQIGAGRTLYEPWILDATEIDKVGTSTFVLADGYFTTCDLGDPHYTFRADEIKLRRDDVIVAKPVVLYFSDIPVFLLPWYVEPVTRGRSSGFLRPKIGINSLLFGTGNERNVQDIGYYWAINEFADLKLAADWYTESRFIMRLDGRYSLRHEFQGSAHLEQVYNRLDDSSSRLVRVSHDHTIGPDTRAQADINWSNSRSFLQRNSFDPEEILQRSFRSAASYSTRFDWGSLVAGANADLSLEQNRTDYQVPNVSLSINQRPLWGSGRRVAGEDAPWYSRLQYNARGSFRWDVTTGSVDSLGNPVSRIPTDSLGRPIDLDEATIRNEQTGTTSFTLNGPLDLFGVIQTTPSVTYGLNLLNDEAEDGEGLGGSGQLNSGLSMSTKFFRIFNAVPGPWFTAMRHTISPRVSFSYSPEPDLFGSFATEDRTNVGRERLNSTWSFEQNFEAKMPIRRDGPAAADSIAADSVSADSAAVGADGVREVETRTVNLLNVTNSFNFDIRRHREEGRLGFGNLSTRLTSGLGRDFNVSMTMEHELVDPGVGEDDEDTFSPFLSRVTTDFSISGGGGISVSRNRGVLEGGNRVFAGRGADDRTDEARENLATAGPEGGGFGPWSLSLAHQWSRSRGGETNRQSLGIRTSLLPTTHWSLNYSTNYDITNGELQAQTLSLVRDLHDWQATLGVNLFPSEPQDRILISFAVYLREVPDLEVPYRVRRE